MKTPIMITMIILTMMMMMKILSTLMKTKKTTKSTKPPFECGFSNYKNPNIPFSIQFFMMTIMFVIFDIEISLLLSMLLSSKTLPMKMWIKSSMLFLLIMHMTLIYETMKGATKWLK